MNSISCAAIVLYLVTLVKLSQTEDIFDVTKFGADLKGIGKSTDAIKQAIDLAVGKGGGTVYFPKGEYLSGPIHLKSNVTLQFEDGTVLKFTTDIDDYMPMIRMRWEGTEVLSLSPLIYAYKQKNIVIKGKATLEGQGSFWFNYWKQLQHQWYQNGTRDTKWQKEFLRLNNLTELAKETMDMSRLGVAFLRPPFIQPFETKNILIQDIIVQNSPFWNFNPVFCENVTIKYVQIKAPYDLPNTDGIDPDSSKDVYISNVDFSVGDDCIAIKSGRDGQGRRIGRPTENVVITDCKMFRGVSGVAIGSEQSGGVHNVTVKNCVFNGTDRGIYIKSERGRGGIVENLLYDNITMIGIVRQAIVMTMDYSGSSKKPEPFSERTPVFRNIRIQNINGDSNTAADLSGLSESLLENIELKNIKIESKNGFTANYTTDLKINGFSQ